MKRAAEVKGYIKRYPSATRNKISIALGIDQGQLMRGEAEGLFKLPQRAVKVAKGHPFKRLDITTKYH